MQRSRWWSTPPPGAGESRHAISLEAIGAVLESAMQKVHDILEQCVECHAA